MGKSILVLQDNKRGTDVMNYLLSRYYDVTMHATDDVTELAYKAGQRSVVQDLIKQVGAINNE